MKKNKNKAWIVENLFDENTNFWEFSEDEIEDYYWRSFQIKYKLYFQLFDIFLIGFFVIYVLNNIL